MKKLIILALCASIPAACQAIIAGQDSTNTVRIVKTDTQGQVYIANPGGGGSTTISGGQSNSGAPVTGSPVTVSGSNGANTQIFRTDTGGALATTQSVAGADGAANTNLAQITNNGGTHSPLEIAQFLFNGSTWDRQYYCTQSAPISISGTTDTQIVALAAAQIVRICNITATLGGTTPTMTIEYGTGTNCGTGKTALTGAMAPTAGTTLAINPGPQAALRSGSGAAVCLVLSGTSPTAAGFMSYAQY